MDHTEAISKGAAARYQFGGLSVKETEEFEAHFFDCTHCAEELRAAAIFEENAKAVFLENSRSTAGAGEPRGKYERGRASWWALFWRNPWSAAPAAAAAALLCVVMYQGGMIQRARAPQAMASLVLPSLSRGSDRVLEVPASDNVYALSMYPEWQTSYLEYICIIQDEKGSTLASLRASAPAPGKPIQILMHRSKLPSGRYTLIVRHPAANGQPESELARDSFILKLD